MNKVTKVMTVSFITNLFLSVIKILFGYVLKTSALVADGVHSMSDLTTDLVAIIGSKIARKPADKEHPFGHGKIEYITSLLISILILFLGFKIIFNGVNSEISKPNIYMTFVCLFTIVSKYILSSYILRKGYKYNDSILIASGKESKTDVLSSIVVLVSGILMYFSKYISILKYSDLVATIIVGIFIVKIGFNILKENLSSIIGEQETDKSYINKIKKIILSNENIITVDEIVLLKYGYCYKLIGEVSMNKDLSLIKSHEIIHKVEKVIKKSEPRIMYITFHINPSLKD